MSSSLNKFLHGTLWKWIPNELALIISNDEYNSQSSDVNCVSVMDVMGDSISIDNIQCNQVHTVEKAALNEFMGAVPAPILAAAKTKIQKQFNMGDDKTLHAVQETAARLIGQLAQMDSEYAPSNPPAAMPTATVDVPVAPTPKSPPPNTVADVAVEADMNEAPPDAIPPEKPTNDALPAPEKKPTKPAKPTPKPRGKKQKQTVEVSPRTGKPKREMRNYTDEDEAFVLDGNPTTQEIMDRFGFTENRKVHDVKFQLKKRRSKRENTN